MSINSLTEWDGIRRERFEIVRVRCSVCRYECYCAIPMTSPRNDIVVRAMPCARACNPGGAQCSGPLIIIGARGIAHRVLPIDAPRYDVQLAPPLPHAPNDPRVVSHRVMRKYYSDDT